MGRGKAGIREQKPLDIRLSLTVNFGDSPEDTVRIIPERRLKFAGNVLLYRDCIIRFLLFNTLRAAAEQPSVYQAARKTPSFEGGDISASRVSAIREAVASACDGVIVA